MRRHRLVAWAALYGVVAVGLFFVAGEEISWGRRLLGFATPHELEEINSQGESTIHNVGAAQELFKAGEFSVALFGIAAPLLVRSRFRPRRASHRRFAALTAPPLVLVPLFAVMAGYRIARYTVVPKTWVTVEATETAELCLAIGIAAFIFLLARRLRASATKSWIDRNRDRSRRRSGVGQLAAFSRPQSRLSSVRPGRRPRRWDGSAGCPRGNPGRACRRS